MHEDLIKLERILKSKVPITHSAFPVQKDNKLIHSAVMVPFLMINDQVHLLFTLRSKALPRHSGQVSFPGGFIEENDGSAGAAALRETCEEIGICDADIKIAGQLEPFNSGTGYYIYPYVGFIADISKMCINQKEVEKIFFIPFKWLQNEDNAHIELYKTKDGSLRDVWFYNRFEGELLWGISARITKDVINLLKE